LEDDMTSTPESGASGSGDNGSPITLTGRLVVDPHLAKIGTVTDVLSDDVGARRWAIVKTGVLSGERVMPLEDTYVDTDGRLVATINKAIVKHAPRVRGDHVLTVENRRELRDYYNVAA
jgi:hypothetical protein